MESTNGYRYPMGDKNTASECIINAVAEIEDEDPTGLSPPLYEAIDPDALDNLVASQNTSRVQFEYSNHRVTVTSDEIIVTAIDG